MSDRDALLAAILANPDEDTPRLVYADWLEEHGDAPRAEFIRVQIELARQREAEADLPDSFGTWHPYDTAERLKLRKREEALLAAHAGEWMGGLPGYATNKKMKFGVGFRRGFVGHVRVSLGPLLRSPGALWKHHPVEALTPWSLDAAALPAWTACRPLAALRELKLTDPRHDPALLGPFLAVPHLANVRHLDLWNKRVPSAGVRALARAPMRPVTFLLGCEQLDPGAFGALLHSPFAARLRRFMPFRVGDWGAAVIADAPLTGLRHLSLIGCDCGDEGAGALTRSSSLTELVTLDLSYNALTDAALKSLAAWPGLASVRALDLRSNERITGRGVAALVRSPHFRPHYLDLTQTAAGTHRGPERLAAWPGLADVLALNLFEARVTATGAAALAASPHWRAARYVSLGSNGLSREVKARLRARLSGCEVDVED